MLKVPCGISGRVRIVKENSITGEVTHESEFENIWTDLGLSKISVYASQNALWPTVLIYGSGARSTPHSAVTTLSNYIGSGSVNYQDLGGVNYDSTTCTVTRTSSITVNPRGTAWTLNELALSDNSRQGTNIPANTSAMTYTLTKNSAGVPTPVQVSDIEIITIYYTIQIQYPMSLPPMSIEVEGLPSTTATFSLRPDIAGFAAYAIGASSPLSSDDTLKGFTSAAFAGAVASAKTGTRNVWGINVLNRQTEYFGSNFRSAHHTWKLDPPITKDNTQVLELEIFWQFTNATPIEITPP